MATVLAVGLLASAGVQAATWAEKWQRQYQANDVEAALKTIRAEIAKPSANDPRELASLRILGLRSLSRYATLRDTPPEFDDEALRYHDDGVRLAPDALVRANIDLALADYYSATQRNGRGVPYLLSAGSAFERAGEKLRYWETLNLLALAHADRGDLASYEATWTRASEIAPQVFAPGSTALTPEQWRAYWNALSTRMNLVASPYNNAAPECNLPAIEAVWPEFERAGRLYVRPIAATYAVGADVFGVCGALDRAAELWKLAQKEAAHEKTDPVVMTCVPAALATYRGAANAADLEAGCISAYEKHSRTVAAPAWRWAGEAQERAGRLEDAKRYYQRGIEVAERVRGSFTLAERAAVFRTSLRTLYWGLLRTQARKGELLESLQTADRVRARQLGEVLAQSGKEVGQLESLAQLRAWLAPEDALLSYVVMEREVLLIAVTRTEQKAVFIDLDFSHLTESARELSQMLATASSPLPDIEHRLCDLGQKLVLPVAGLLEGKRRLVVVPDGALNAIPFDLLCVRPGAYHALIDDVSLRLSPSIAFLLSPPAARGAEALLAVGDPNYRPDPAPGGIRAATLAPARGSSYLRYFTPLPETRTEVDGIAALFRGSSNQLLLGAEAKESTIKHANLSGIGFLHFATHGVLGNDVPGLVEPALVFSDESGEDGFLTASEAAALDLHAQLAVLSACKTGAGDYFSGEGVMGLSRAFLLAGTSSVLVSLWSVDSNATEELMLAFYERFRRSGLAPEEALRQAKLGIREGKAVSGAARGVTLTPDDAPPAQAPRTRRAHPYFWSAFVLVGH